uniref:class I tRNA ligase family protein n=1 Tax=Sandarakinorhabdus sp. TaxID=1916663 RepID=UPI0033429BF5
DSLYCDAPTALTRRAWRTVLDLSFHALTRWLAPVLVFTAEEVWGTRYPDAGSVHLLEWPEIAADWQDDALGHQITLARQVREDAYLKLEELRRAKAIGSFLEAYVCIETTDEDHFVACQALDLAEYLLVARVDLVKGASNALTVGKVDDAKCARCWRHLPDVAAETGLCGRCDEVINA